MSKSENLSDLYTEELQDLWSANDQMKSVVEKMAEAAVDTKLADRFKRSAAGIQKHTDLLKSLVEDLGESGKDHCKGMEGLVAEAKKHALEAGLEGPVRDVALIAQYQRMCHYGIAGFGTAKAFAKALGHEDHVSKLDAAVDAIYESDQYMTDLAEHSKNLEAASR